MELSVLVVDDNRGMRKALYNMLASRMHVCAFYEAGSVAEGMAKISENVPDLVLVELDLPDANGLEMIRSLRQSREFNRLPVIAVTADHQPDKIQPLRDMGLQVVTKPFRYEKIVEMIYAYERFSSPRVTERLLDQASRTVFRKLVSLILRPSPTKAGALDEPRARAIMRFSGLYNGTLILDASRTLLPILRNNLLGVAAAGSYRDAEGLDALGELANVLCGNLLELMGGPEMMFDLHPPVVTTQAEDIAPAPDKAFMRRWISDKGWIELFFIRDFPRKRRKVDSNEL